MEQGRKTQGQEEREKPLKRETDLRRSPLASHSALPKLLRVGVRHGDRRKTNSTHSTQPGGISAQIILT